MRGYMSNLGLDSLPPLSLKEAAQPSNRAKRGDSLAEIARLVLDGTATSKTALMNATDLSRSTISSYADFLVREGLLSYVGSKPSVGRGRPTNELGANSESGVVLIIDAGARSAFFAVATLDQKILAIRHEPIKVNGGPEEVLDAYADVLWDMLDQVMPNAKLLALVLGLPARVSRDGGIPIRPGIMPDWDGYSVRNRMHSIFGCPVIVENDVNLRAIGEAAALDDSQLPLLAVKVGTGIGAGLVGLDGGLYNGYDGAAGEIGHVPVRSAPAIRCLCGTTGCTETVASTPALVRRTKEEHPGLLAEDEDFDEFLKLLATEEPGAVDVVRTAAHALGEAVSILCNTLNPRRIALTGVITVVSDEMLAGVRAVVYSQARPLATRNLVIGTSVLGEASGIAGGLVVAIRSVLSPKNMNRLIESAGH